MIEWRSSPLLFACHWTRVCVPVPVGHSSMGMFVGVGYKPYGETPPLKSESPA